MKLQHDPGDRGWLAPSRLRAAQLAFLGVRGTVRQATPGTPQVCPPRRSGTRIWRPRTLPRVLQRLQSLARGRAYTGGRLASHRCPLPGQPCRMTALRLLHGRSAWGQGASRCCTTYGGRPGVLGVDWDCLLAKALEKGGWPDVRSADRGIRLLERCLASRRPDLTALTVGRERIQPGWDPAGKTLADATRYWANVKGCGEHVRIRHFHAAAVWASQHRQRVGHRVRQQSGPQQLWVRVYLRSDPGALRLVKCAAERQQA